MDVRIGIIQAPREIDLELPDGESQEDVHNRVEAALEKAEGVLWLTDKRGKRVGVPVARIAYVEIGTDDSRRVGFGTS